MAISSPLPFSAEEFLKSITKLTFYLIAGILLTSQIAEASWDGAASIVYRVLLVHSVIATGLYVVTWTTPGWIDLLPLPGYDSPTSGFYFHLRWFGDSSTQCLEHLAFPRAQGLLCEPSGMAATHVLGLGYVLLSPRRLSRLGSGHLLIVLSVVLSFSLTGYVFLLVVVLLTALRRRREAGHHFASRRLLCVAVLLGALLTLTPAVRSTMQYAIGRRMAGCCREASTGPPRHAWWRTGLPPPASQRRAGCWDPAWGTSMSRWRRSAASYRIPSLCPWEARDGTYRLTSWQPPES